MLNLLKLHQRVQGEARQRREPFTPSAAPSAVPRHSGHPDLLAQRATLLALRDHRIAVVLAFLVHVGPTIRAPSRPHDPRASHEAAVSARRRAMAHERSRRGRR